MNDEWVWKCGIHAGELGHPSLPLPLHPTSFAHTVSINIKNAAQDMIPATALFTSAMSLNDCPTLSAILFCTLAVNLPDNLVCYMDCAPLFLPASTLQNHLETFLSLAFILPA